VPERQRHRPRAASQIVAAENGDDARRVRERRYLREQLGGDVLSGGENVRGLEPGGEAGLEQILALDREQPELVPPAPVVELADELEPLVVARGDQTD
jgi:hypothetical protein